MDQVDNDNSFRNRLGNNLNKVSRFIDEHLREVRSGTTLFVFVYTIFTLRKTRGFYRFVNIHNIPNEDFGNRIKLNGIITDVNTNTGVLKFYHRPIFLRIFNPEYHKIMTEEERIKIIDESLNVKMYGINAENALGPMWLSSVIKRQAVELTLYSKSDNDGSNIENNDKILKVVNKNKDSLGEKIEIENDETTKTIENVEKGIVYGKVRCRMDGSWFKKDIGEIALKKGLASNMIDVKANGLPIVSHDIRDREMITLEKKYLENERYAQKNNLGIWENFDDYKSTIADATYMMMMKNFFSAAYHFIRNRKSRAK